VKKLAVWLQLQSRVHCLMMAAFAPLAVAAAQQQGAVAGVI
jgi:hypothetical protein